MDLLTIMSVMEITRDGETFQLKDEGLGGFIIELEDLIYYNDFSGYAFVQFKCFDDFSKFLDIDCRLNNLYPEEHGLSTLLRNEERLFYYNLKKVEKFVDYCKKIEIDHQDHDAFFYFFTEIRNLLENMKKVLNIKIKK